MTARTVMNAITAAMLAACSSGGGGGSGVDPKLIAGGGVADGPIDGTLHVFAVELGSSTPIANATVKVDATTATTDASGLATFDGVSGKQTVTVTAPGHAAATWIGVAGANVTIPLEPSPHPIPQARVSGTIAGWNSLPPPTTGNYTLGVVLYSFAEDPTALENSIPQPLNGTTPLNTCTRTAISNMCSFQLNARVGKQVHTAVIVEGNPNGTANDITDDTYTLKGYASTDAMTLTADQQVSNESLTMVTGTTPFAVAFPTPPSGLSYVAAIPELSLDDGSGRIVFPLPTLGNGRTSTEVLAPTGKFAGSYELVAVATPSATAATPYSTAFVHDVSGSATVPAWLAPPSQVNPGATFSFTAPQGAAFSTALLSRGTTPLWNVTVLDGSSSFQLPLLTPDPLGGGQLTFAVSAADVPGFNATSFDIPTMKTGLARASGAQSMFTR